MRLMTELENEIRKFEQLSRRLRLIKPLKNELLSVNEPIADYAEEESKNVRKVSRRKKE